MPQPKLNQLLRKAALRKQIASNVGRFSRAFIAVSLGLFCLLLIARLLGVIPDFFKPTHFWIIPAASALVALALHRRLAPAHVARELDERAGSKELFLTAIATASMQHEFGQLVVEQAETRAEKTDAAALFPFHWQRGAIRMTISSLLLIATAMLLPQFDPFKFNEKRLVVAKKEERLEATKIATATRKAELAKEDKRTTEQIQTALLELDKTFKAAKPQERDLNERKLNEQSRNLNDYWKRLSPAIPKADMQSASQKFGATNQKDIQKMVDQLKKGDASELNKEIQNLLDQAKKAAATTDPAARKEQMERLAKQLADLSNQLKEQVGSKALDDALSRALEQMSLASTNSLSADGASGACDSLQLSQDELAQMAEAFKDMQNLEDALKAMQMARQLNQMGKLDGKECGNCTSLADYAAMYQQMLANGKSGGQSGPNQGQAFGGSVGENDFTNSNFEVQKTNAQISAGKMLMEWKDKGVGETGVRGDYQEALEAVKQSVSEAIRNEKVPAGYHSTIQKYFDSLPDKR